MYIYTYTYIRTQERVNSNVIDEMMCIIKLRHHWYNIKVCLLSVKNVISTSLHSISLPFCSGGQDDLNANKGSLPGWFFYDPLNHTYSCRNNEYSLGCYGNITIPWTELPCRQLCLRYLNFVQFFCSECPIVLNISLNFILIYLLQIIWWLFLSFVGQNIFSNDGLQCHNCNVSIIATSNFG